jgi:hypothetical protein
MSCWAVGGGWYKHGVLERAPALAGLLAAAAIAMPVPSAHAAPRGASQLQLAPSAASLRFGATPSYLPAANVPVRIEIRATGRKGRRLLGRKLRGRVGGLGRCARSFAGGEGRPLVFRRGRDFLGAKFQGSRTVRLQASPNLRFCLWFSRSPRARVGAVRRTVNVAPGMFGAAMSYIGRFGLLPGGGPNLVVSAAATAPFSVTKSGPCANDDPETDAAGLATISGLYQSGTLFQNWPDTCTGSLTTSYAPGLSLTYSRDEYFGPKPLKAIGDCFTGSAIGLDANQAKAYLTAVGCRPGRVLSRRSSNSRQRGEVFEFSVAGARATLVPRGTVVDIVTAR